jgi:hypothetical protein
VSRSGYGQVDFDPDDWQKIEAAGADGDKILPGSKYRKVVYTDGGELRTYRARLEIDAVCEKYEMFDEC